MAIANPSSTITRKTPKKPKHLAMGVASCVIVFLAIFFACFFMSKKESDMEDIKHGSGKQGTIKEVAPGKPVEHQEQAVPVSHDDEAKAKLEKLRAMSPAEKLEFLYEEAKKKPFRAEPPDGRTFRSGTEQVMSWIFTTKLGDPPPPLPRLSIYDEVHMAEILISDNPVYEDDSENVKFSKEIVDEAKKELINFIKEGGQVEDFLVYYRDQLVEAHQQYNSAKRKVYEAFRTEPDLEACDIYLKRINAELAEKGIKEVVVPEQLIEKFNGQLQNQK